MPLIDGITDAIVRWGPTIGTIVQTGVLGIGAGLFVLVGAAVAAAGWARDRRASRSTRWPVATGVITKSRTRTVVARRRGESDEVVPVVHYRYAVAGRSFVGGTVTIGDRLEDAPPERTLERYPIGATVEVRYNPDDPADSVLEPGGRQNVLPTVLGLAFVIVGLAVLVGLARSLT